MIELTGWASIFQRAGDKADRLDHYTSSIVAIPVFSFASVASIIMRIGPTVKLHRRGSVKGYPGIEPDGMRLNPQGGLRPYLQDHE